MAQSAVRMHLVMMGEPVGQLIDNVLSIWPRVHAEIIALEGANERLRHAVRLGLLTWVVRGISPI